MRLPGDPSRETTSIPADRSRRCAGARTRRCGGGAARQSGAHRRSSQAWPERRGAAGGGTATLSKTYGDLFGDIPVNAAGADRHPRLSFRGRGGAIASATPVRVREDFFIAGPQVNTVPPLTKWLHLDAGVGYRLIGGADLLNDDIRGVSGSIALQLGGR